MYSYSFRAAVVLAALLLAATVQPAAAPPSAVDAAWDAHLSDAAEAISGLPDSTPLTDVADSQAALDAQLLQIGVDLFGPEFDASALPPINWEEDDLASIRYCRLFAGA